MVVILASHDYSPGHATLPQLILPTQEPASLQLRLCRRPRDSQNPISTPLTPARGSSLSSQARLESGAVLKWREQCRIEKSSLEQGSRPCPPIPIPNPSPRFRTSSSSLNPSDSPDLTPSISKPLKEPSTTTVSAAQIPEQPIESALKLHRPPAILLRAPIVPQQYRTRATTDSLSD
ncbi:uncharacterized protein B0I36DRAFT_76368 [Microdochium trichocladiopsis]|uniref:Uncharacterized protein n=1 Tax=Microdochium trichocladiopsis TaxID=1682393 RepID=A0A9P8YHR2_9PEZI|nr:uncharacterized protein B0I36DRAFT_76368 [Microdochium trichocladiopsis]KAH7038169.1 hypothetical protein B0I36DRAFT_76368 [Microdochium trichocladiopsis]